MSNFKKLTTGRFQGIFRFFLFGFCTCLFSGLKAAPLHAKGTKYQVEFRGVENLRQMRSLKDSSSLVRYRKSSTKSLAALKYRAEQDIPEFLQVLHAYGYYDACVSTRAFRQPSGKFKMVVAVNKGDPYLLNRFDYKAFDEPKELLYDISQIKLHELGLKLNKPALSTQIVGAQKQLVSILGQNGHPFAKIEDSAIVVDQALKTVNVDLKVDEGPIAYFGKLCIEGGKGVKKRFISNRVAWKEGELFSSLKIAETEKNLYDSGLFSIVTVSHGSGITNKNHLPMKIDLMDSKYNNFTVGGSYTTTWQGIGGAATWQNRNILRSGLNVKLNYGINQKKQDAGLEFLFPDFFSAKNKLVAQTDVLIKNEMPNYQEKGVNTNIFVERIFSRYFKASLGGRFDQFRTSESLRNGYFSLFGVPFFTNLQSSDKVLINPTQGGWASLNFTPFFSLSRDVDTFAEAKIEGSVYQYLIPSRRVVLAMNMVFGSLFGSTTFNIPPPYRFFAGSPQHLRGYAYQKVSPLDANGKEIGGRSLFLWSIEPRFMVLKSFAVVGFFDVGNVYLSSWPKWNNTFVKSLGVGVRYFSFVGPLRLDIGFPLDKRRNVDRDYQIYFSIGQAF